MILVGTLHSLTIASSAITNPDSAINQKACAQELIAQSPVPTSAQPTSITSPASSQIPTSDTALLFQNDRYAVRVFREGDRAYLNIYDKANQTQKLNKVPVSITPANNPKKDQTKYIATIGNQQFTVTINPQGFSKLIILQGGTVVYQQVSNQIEIARQIPGISDQSEPPNPTRELIGTLFSNYAKLTLFALMFSMGIHWTFEDVVWLWKQPSLLLRSLFSVFVAVPLFAILALFIPGLTVPERIGIGAMIACPGAPMIPFKSIKAGGNVKFVASLQFAVCVLAIFSIPLIAVILAQFYPNQAWLSPDEIAKQIFFAQVLPMGLGVLLAQYAPKVAEDLLEPMTKIAKFLLLLLAIVLLVVSLEKVVNAGFPAYLAMGSIAIASLACGHFLGGSHVENQTVLAYATVTRNAGLALLLVTLNFPNLDYVKGGIINTLITYALIAAIVSIPYTTWRKRNLVADEKSF
ncbi:hypothetical protein NIES2119_05875 [[Phormidium ambiguum] IAM M-71]|uniref:Sodium dependent transporter n=1 Tax=[Phormidium ambiguum] IAM M-71 TaxID=454136 RepID=A0A1U7IR10_9CYAN|nr:hypothetical protein [Phormidium ambiguum]OKH39772.1 hypothetical protein NIES2119_05875 [Phormidium ambiguum IAM M-71]